MNSLLSAAAAATSALFLSVSPGVVFSGPVLPPPPPPPSAVSYPVENAELTAEAVRTEVQPYPPKSVTTSPVSATKYLNYILVHATKPGRGKDWISELVVKRAVEQALNKVIDPYKIYKLPSEGGRRFFKKPPTTYYVWLQDRKVVVESTKKKNLARILKGRQQMAKTLKKMEDTAELQRANEEKQQEDEHELRIIEQRIKAYKNMELVDDPAREDDQARGAVALDFQDYEDEEGEDEGSEFLSRR